MKRGYGVWIVAGIIVVVAIAFFIKQQGILLSPKLGGPGATTGEDVCPNPKNSATVCVGEKACQCQKDGKDYWWTISKDKSCSSSAPSGCKSDTIKEYEIKVTSEACTMAGRTINAPGVCTGKCEDDGVIDGESTVSSCCTVTKERNCVPKAGGIATQ